MGTRREKRGDGSGGLTVWSGNKTSPVRNDHRGEVVSNPLILANHSSTVGVSACLPQKHKRGADDPFFFSALTGNWRREKGILRYRAFFERRCVRLGALFFPPARAGKRRVAFRPSAPKGIPPPNDRSLSPSPSLPILRRCRHKLFLLSSLSGKLRNRPREGEERAEEAPLLICLRCLLQTSQAVKNAIWIMSQS